MLRVGDPIPLSAVLWDQSDSKFVRAYAFSADNQPMPWSPVGVPNRGRGLYEENSFTMPDTDHVTVVYEIYDDALFLNRSCEYMVGGERFDRDEDLINETDVEMIIDHVTDQVNRLIGFDVEVEISQDQIQVEVEQNEISVEVVEAKVDTEITQDQVISAKIKSDDVSAEITADALDVDIKDC